MVTFLDPTFTTLIFVFAMVFGTLELTKVFKNRGVNAIISVALALFAVQSASFVVTLQSYFPLLIWVFVLVFVIAFIAKLFKTHLSTEEATKSIAILGIVIIVFFTIGMNYIPSSDILGKRDVVLLAGLIIMIYMFLIAYRVGMTQVAAKGG